MQIFVVSLEPSKSVLPIDHDYSSECLIQLIIFEISFFNKRITLIKNEWFFSTTFFCLGNEFYFPSQTKKLIGCGLDLSFFEKHLILLDTHVLG